MPDKRIIINNQIYWVKKEDKTWTAWNEFDNGDMCTMQGGFKTKRECVAHVEAIAKIKLQHNL